jgi:hypothetical protein
MTNQSKKNKAYLKRNGLEIINVVLPRETKRAFKSNLSLEGKSMNDYLLKCIYKYVAKKSKSN